MYVDCFGNEPNYEIISDPFVPAVTEILADEDNIVELRDLQTSQETMKKIVDSYVTDTNIAILFSIEKREEDKTFVEQSFYCAQIMGFKNETDNSQYVEYLKFKALGQVDYDEIEKQKCPVLIFENSSQFVEDATLSAAKFEEIPVAVPNISLPKKGSRQQHQQHQHQHQQQPKSSPVDVSSPDDYQEMSPETNIKVSEFCNVSPINVEFEAPNKKYFYEESEYNTAAEDNDFSSSPNKKDLQNDSEDDVFYFEVPIEEVSDDDCDHFLGPSSSQMQPNVAKKSSMKDVQSSTETVQHLSDSPKMPEMSILSESETEDEPKSEQDTENNTEHDTDTSYLDHEILAIPTTVPYFPNTYINSFKVKNPILQQAIVQLIEGTNYGQSEDVVLGLFYIKNSLFKPSQLIRQPKDIHNVGVSAKVVSYKIVKDKSQQEVLYLDFEVLSRIQIEKYSLPVIFQNSVSRKGKIDFDKITGIKLNKLVTFVNVSPIIDTIFDPSKNDSELKITKKFATNSLIMLRQILKLFKTEIDSPNLIFYNFRTKFESSFQDVFTSFDQFNKDYGVNNILNLFNCYQDDIDTIMVKIEFLVEILRTFVNLKYEHFYRNYSSASNPRGFNLYESLYNNNKKDYFAYHNSKLQEILETEEIYKQCKLIHNVYKHESSILQFEVNEYKDSREAMLSAKLNRNKTKRASYFGKPMQTK